MPEPKKALRAGELIHYSVGAFVRRGDEVLLIDRNNPPYGLAGIAGHVDEGEEPGAAIAREVSEESGFALVSVLLLKEEFVPLNTCSKGVNGHYWYIFGGEVSGDPIANLREVRSIGWYSVADLPQLNLEPVWRLWFEQLGLM